MDWDIVIGLEVHVQLNTETKAFCSCKVNYGDPPNTNVCPVCLAYPGALPVLNKELVNSAIKLGLATNCSIRPRSTFARKNYFYPDLPKGYQISQFDDPICYEGYVDIEVEGQKKRIGLTRIHMEEDAGKSMHSESGTLVDLNRCGTALLEIVSEPDISTPQEAYAYLTTLKQIVRYTGVSDCNMEEGSMRCDANISIKPKGQKELGTRTELKNMNSFRNVERALIYEAKRQQKVLEAGGVITQQTLLWDEQGGKTKAMRSKENSHDYRYFPEPDLSPVFVDETWIENMRKLLPELPAERKQRFMDSFSFTLEDAGVLTSEKEIADYFEATLKYFDNPKLVLNWVRNEILRILVDTGKNINESPVSPKALAELLVFLNRKEITAQTAKAIIDEMAVSGKSAAIIIEDRGLKQISDSSALEKMIDTIIDNNTALVKRYKDGDTKLLGFFIGQVMKISKGQADQAVARDIIIKKLG
ncbi:MAG: Asp-tRNA(Asn)/Glu-tRNA(Gln) amidotransferase GatCAB subunit B [Candidatus Neomarinimicrobiota bacterium]|nr:MAG: Asp-tRNA(Asn)/Glu-tRNA(Gln) amidotransferase GatCAB subunit B [Candidatus Neomarinimicrobiota bacterium]